MDPFKEYLSYVKQSLTNIYSYENIHVVIGNEACDLDSMVSALALAYYLYKVVYNDYPMQTLVIPVLNIPCSDFTLRTENEYVLNKLNIDYNILVFRDEISFEKIQRSCLLRISLVDHHILRPEDEFVTDCVVQIFDHRPRDPKVTWEDLQANLNIKEVGSCCTLIADEIFKTNEEILTHSLASLLYDTITFDTIAYNPAAGKVKELDLVMADKLEKRFVFSEDRKTRFDELWTAHNDVSHLTPKQLLSKDLKIINGLPIPGLPMLVEHYLKLPNVVADMISFCEQKDCPTLLLMGLHVDKGRDDKNEVKRDLAVFTKETNKNVSDAIITSLKNSEELQGPALCLQEVFLNIPNLTYFKQTNSKPTRKQIIPLVRTALESYRAQNKTAESSCI